jgi:ankyrin repeat protein
LHIVKYRVIKYAFQAYKDKGMFSTKTEKTLITLPNELAPSIIDYLDLNNQRRLALTSIFFFNQFKCKREQLIALGCSRKALEEVFEIIKNSPEVIVNYNTLNFNIKRMPVVPAQEVPMLYARTQIDTAVKLLCLTGELSGITKVIEIIQKDTTTLHEQISIQVQQNINYVLALNFTAYTNNVTGLQLLWEQIDKDVIIGCPNLQLIPFINAIYSNNLGTLKWVVNAFKIMPKTIEMEENLLILAAKVGNVEMMKYAILDCHMDKNSVSGRSDYNALQIAASFGKLDAVKYAMTLKLPYVSNANANLLHYAFQSGDLETINYFLELGINPLEKTIFGTTILHRAAKYGQAQAMSLAVNLGVSPHELNEIGVNALHLAVKSGSLRATQYAITFGIDLKTSFKNSFHALHLSILSGNVEVFEYLVSLMDAFDVRAIFKENVLLIQDIIMNGMGVPGLKVAVKYELDLALVILEEGANLLHVAAAQTFNYLLNDANIKPIKNSNQATILHEASLSDDPKMFRLAYDALKNEFPDQNPLEDQDAQNDTVKEYIYNQGRYEFFDLLQELLEAELTNHLSQCRSSFK